MSKLLISVPARVKRKPRSPKRTGDMRCVYGFEADGRAKVVHDDNAAWLVQHELAFVLQNINKSTLE